MATSKSENQRASRRRWSLAEKRRIVELTMREGSSIRVIAHEQGVHPTSLSHWKALYRAGKLDARASHVRACVSSATLLPVTIMPARHAQQIANDPGGGPSIVQITFLSGATMRMETGVLDAGVICAVIAQLRR